MAISAPTTPPRATYRSRPNMTPHDRTVSVTLADASTTRSAYTIGSLDGVPMLETKVTDVPDRTMVRTLP